MALKKYAQEYQDLGSEVQRFEAAREVHEKLCRLLGDKRTFFGSVAEEVKDEDEPLLLMPDHEERLTSLDIVAWAYLKEELVNTGET